MLFMAKSSTKRHTPSEDVCLSLVFYTGRISNQFMKLHVVYQIVSLNTREFSIQNPAQKLSHTHSILLQV